MQFDGSGILFDQYYRLSENAYYEQDITTIPVPSNPLSYQQYADVTSATIAPPGTVAPFFQADDGFIIDLYDTAYRASTILPPTIFTPGSVPFAGVSGQLTENNVRFNYNNTNGTLSITGINSAQSDSSFRILNTGGLGLLWDFRNDGSVFFSTDKFIGQNFTNISMGIGRSAFNAGVSTATNVTAIGGFAGQNITTGSGNTLIGRNAGQAITTGGNCTMIGVNTVGSSTLQNAICIGFGANTSINNSCVFGQFVSQYFFGNGSVSNTTSSPILCPNSAQTANISMAASQFTIGGSRGTGTGLGGSVRIQTALAGASGSSVNPYQTHVEYLSSGWHTVFQIGIPGTNPVNGFHHYANSSNQPEWRLTTGDVVRLQRFGAIPNPSGGIIVDNEARNAITQVLNVLRNLGIINP